MCLGAGSMDALQEPQAPEDTNPGLNGRQMQLTAAGFPEEVPSGWGRKSR